MVDLLSWHESQGVIFLRVELPASDVTVVFTTRDGGVSMPPYASLNLGLHTGDERALVIENRRRVFSALALDIRQLVLPEQVHGNQVAMVTSAQCGKGSLSLADAVAGVDALITNDPKVVLGALYADCVPVVLIDQANAAVALIHAGWRGTLAGIAGRAVMAMRDSFGSNPGQLQAIIGPSIGPCCYRVSADMAIAFRRRWPSLPIAQANQPYLDLRAANRLDLQAQGLKVKSIHDVAICTKCHDDLFFSHRASLGKGTGRFAALVKLGNTVAGVS